MSKSKINLKELEQDIDKILAFVDKVNKILGKDCGCKERKKKLNKMFPYEKYLDSKK